MFLRDQIVSHPVSGRTLLLRLVFVVLGGFIASQLLSSAVILLYAGSADEAMRLASALQQSPVSPDLRWLIILMQSINSISLFLIPPLFYVQLQGLQMGDAFVSKHRRWPTLMLITSALAFVAFPFISYTYEWNMTWEFPGAFGEWAVAQEDMMNQYTDLLLNMDGPTDLLVIFIVVGIIPAVGEELLFRGLLLPHLGAVIRNPHVAIWLTAVIFGVIHFQFFGLVPRVLLGLMLGYLFYWSNSLVYPILLHLVNNGGQVILTYYLTQNGVENMAEEPSTFPFEVVLFSIFLTVICMLYLKKAFGKDHEMAGRL